VSMTDLAMRGARRLRANQHRKSVNPPVMRVVNRRGPAIVNYLCPHYDRPSGGIRTIYRHVDTLNAAGIYATVVHALDGFSCTWFAHHTRVTAARSVALSHQDILVVPEWYGPGFDALPIGPRIVAFNQNAYKTFSGLGESATPGAPYRGVPGLEAALVVSRDNAEYLRFAFPELMIAQVRNAIDPEVFYASGQPAGRRLALMPRKRPDDAHQVLRLLRAHGSLDGWDIVSIEHRSELETAKLLRSCAVFLSFSAQEGFGLPPAEAMASGCYVIGFSGIAGREYFRPEFSHPVEDGDVLAFAKATAAALAEDPATLSKKGIEASSHILACYSLDGQRDDLLGFFAPLLES
jgi:glycosyltransferase involved in cell wall biosynthesis